MRKSYIISVSNDGVFWSWTEDEFDTVEAAKECVRLKYQGIKTRIICLF